MKRLQSNKLKYASAIGAAIGEIALTKHCPVFFNGVRGGTIIEDQKITIRYQKAGSPSQPGRKVRKGDSESGRRASTMKFFHKSNQLIHGLVQALVVLLVVKAGGIARGEVVGQGLKPFPVLLGKIAPDTLRQGNEVRNLVGERLGATSEAAHFQKFPAELKLPSAQETHELAFTIGQSSRPVALLGQEVGRQTSGNGPANRGNARPDNFEIGIYFVQELIKSAICGVIGGIIGAWIYFVCAEKINKKKTPVGGTITYTSQEVRAALAARGFIGSTLKTSNAAKTKENNTAA